jgi:hypothetical protein
LRGGADHHCREQQRQERRRQRRHFWLAIARRPPAALTLPLNKFIEYSYTQQRIQYTLVLNSAAAEAHRAHAIACQSCSSAQQLLPDTTASQPAA